MKKAERIARSFQAETLGQRGAGHSVYLVLLHDPGHSLDERILREQFGY